MIMVTKLYRAQLMRYYDEVLAQSARNYAFTGESIWEKKYFEIQPLSDKLLKDLILISDSVQRDFFIQMHITSQNLVKMECTAIDFVNQKKQKQSIDILDSEKYKKQRKILEEGLENFVNDNIDQDENLAIAHTSDSSAHEIIALKRRIAVLEKELEQEKLSRT